MFEAFSTPRSRRWTFFLFAIGGVLAAAVGAVGIDDNPLGVALAFLSGTALVLALVHPWKTSRQFRRLVYASGLGFVVLAVLSNVFEAVASKVGVQSPFASLLNGAGAIFFAYRHLALSAGTSGGCHCGCSHIQTGAPFATGFAGGLAIAFSRPPAGLRAFSDGRRDQSL
jgi:hypothetical protein